ncbi:hypothetical protein DXG01_009875 [Tephrocybe rancida]|nr:hypothetical protein DXG01_009875 [Tephrocybe rancida]
MDSLTHAILPSPDIHNPNYYLVHIVRHAYDCTSEPFPPLFTATASSRAPSTARRPHALHAVTLRTRTCLHPQVLLQDDPTRPLLRNGARRTLTLSPMALHLPTPTPLVLPGPSSRPAKGVRSIRDEEDYDLGEDEVDDSDDDVPKPTGRGRAKPRAHLVLSAPQPSSQGSALSHWRAGPQRPQTTTGTPRPPPHSMSLHPAPSPLPSLLPPPTSPRRPQKPTPTPKPKNCGSPPSSAAAKRGTNSCTARRTLAGRTMRIGI